LEKGEAVGKLKKEKTPLDLIAWGGVSSSAYCQKGGPV